MSSACLLLLPNFPCQSSLCHRYPWGTGRGRALLVLHLPECLGTMLHPLLLNNLQWKLSLVPLQFRGMPHRKPNCRMSACCRQHCKPSLRRYPHPWGEKMGRKRAVLCTHSLGHGQPVCLGLCVSRCSERQVLFAKWMNSALADLLASTMVWILVRVSHLRVLPVSAPALLYKAKTVAPLHVTAKKNDYKPCVTQSSRQLLCRLSHGCTFIPTAPPSAAPQLPPEGRVGTQGKCCHHFSHRAHLHSAASVIKTGKREYFGTEREWDGEVVSQAAKCWITAVDVIC